MTTDRDHTRIIGPEETLALERSDIYRDSKNSYLGEAGSRQVNSNLMKFCRAHAGHRILDYGCAVGGYCVKLKQFGFECVGVDINETYVETAQKNGIEAHVIKDKLPFEDRSFDTVIIFEVLEHVTDPGHIITEAKRVARKNVLISVPDNSRFGALKGEGLTYDHMLEQDHVNFFTRSSLGDLLSKHFNNYYISNGDPRFVHHLLPWYIRKPLTLLEALGVLKPTFYSGLCAEALL